MQKTIEFYLKSNYGVTHRYVIDAPTRDALTKLTGRTTLTDSDVDALKALGFELKRVLSPEWE